MTICDYCKEDANFTFLCPKCGIHLCREHRKPEDHECQKIHSSIIGTEVEIEPLNANIDDTGDHIHNAVEDNEIDDFIVEETQVIEIETDSDLGDFLVDETQPIAVDHEENEVEDFDDVDDTLEPLIIPKMLQDRDSEIEQIDEIALSHEKEIDEKFIEEEKKIGLLTHLNAIKIPLAVIIIGSLLSGVLMGVLVYPPEDTSNLQQRYDALYEYYTEIQEQNQELNFVIEDLTLELNTLQNKFDEISEEQLALLNDWNSLFNDQTQYLAPSLNKLNAYVAADSTDQMTLSSAFTLVDQAVLFSIMAKTQNIRVGVVTIHGNFTEQITEYTYNVVVTNEDIVVYIDPQTDEMWWNQNYDQVTANTLWDLGQYASVYVTEIKTILEY